MNKKLKITGILLGAIVLFIFIQYRFLDKDVWDPWSLPLSGKYIIIDPGHGGPDGGADSGDIQEKDIALEISKKLRDYLQQQGALVQMIREEDTDLAPEGMKGYSKRKTEDLKKRVQLINESEADLFISIHLNAIPSSKWRGAQTFYYSTYKENEEVAKFIQDELRTNLGNTTRQAKAINGVYLLKSAKKPGALVEVGFLSNPEEKNLLIQDDYQDKVAASIYTGINRYFSDESNPPD
ncbi:N-acetylmuramoyl-L-alanine amidase CwlD [Bacillus sinesaloumensis]|uniref:N-acetylmuramoyl-L-alanine amidase CwlD n=1 Tax=Litchfieldia sinesaloumensis TaxID=1926280 RepID=UPI0009884201|nr:N-acetylmuramoyl-L-alanine amidase CwlD [Bacillus sinesaloumensis]